MYLQNITVHVPRIYEAQKQDIVYIVYIQWKLFYKVRLQTQITTKKNTGNYHWKKIYSKIGTMAMTLGWYKFRRFFFLYISSIL